MCDPGWRPVPPVKGHWCHLSREHLKARVWDGPEGKEWPPWKLSHPTLHKVNAKLRTGTVTSHKDRAVICNPSAVPSSALTSVIVVQRWGAGRSLLNIVDQKGLHTSHLAINSDICVAADSRRNVAWDTHRCRSTYVTWYKVCHDAWLKY